MIGLAAIVELEELWSRNVHDVAGDPPSTPSNLIITELFDANGWGAWLRSTKPGHGNCPNGYCRPPDPDYCGHGAAYGFRRVGLMRSITNRMLPSTKRLANLGTVTWRELGVPDPHVTGEIVRGDVLVVVTSGRTAVGDHIVTALGGPDADGWFPTIEGNASGIRADGSRGKGVVKTRRRAADVRQHIRFTEEHCEVSL